MASTPGSPARARLGALLLGLLSCTPGVSAEPLAVTTRAFAELARPIVRSAPAEVVALARTRVPARIAAPVDALPVNVGDRVAAGDTLARLDCEDFRTRLEGAEARLEELVARRRLAESRLERTRELRASDAASADRLDEVRAEYDALVASVRAQRSTVAAARRDVARCDVEAPFAGAVVARPAERGAFVQPGSPLVELVDPADIVLSARLVGADADTLTPESTARFRAGGRVFPVRLASLVPLAEGGARTREARLRFTGDRPLPGRAGRLEWEAAPRALPAHLVVRRDDTLGVMIAADGRARFVELPEAVEGRPAPADLEDSARVIVRGRHAATDGAPVRVAE